MMLNPKENEKIIDDYDYLSNADRKSTRLNSSH